MACSPAASAQVSFPRAPSPVMGKWRWLPWPSHPEFQNAFLRSGLAQLLSLLPYSPDHQVPPGKAFSWGRGPVSPPHSHLPWAACSAWRYDGGGVGAVWTQAPCAQPSLAAWYEAQLLPDPYPEGTREALAGLGLGALNLELPPQCPISQMLAAAPQVHPSTGCWGW